MAHGLLADPVHLCVRDLGCACFASFGQVAGLAAAREMLSGGVLHALEEALRCHETPIDLALQ